jgi:hypothetical protein
MQDATDRSDERTSFQEQRPYHPSIDLRTDVVMVYGIDEGMPQRVQEWKAAGCVVHLMTGVAWGRYQDYLDGAFDGRAHWDEAQTGRDGEPIWHGGDSRMRIPYMVPTLAYTEYLVARIKPAVDAGVDAIHLEEPEFWDAAGFSGAFKREWEIYYRQPWQSPDESPGAHYKSGKLKQYLYTRCLDRLCSALKDYALTCHGRTLRVFVPTHSLINYTQWRIISPQSRLLDVPTCDGYVAQVWTGTARTPNVYEGRRKERTFETAFLEYGIMQELVRGTDRRVWFLHDPVEDNPHDTWENYRRNYQCTLVASLLHPAVWRYEVTPWPHRVFGGRYRREATGTAEGIPPAYATELLVAMNSLRDMRQDDVAWEHDGPRLGLLLADSAMFQRGIPAGERGDGQYDGTQPWAARSVEVLDDLAWSAFFGLALPLLKDGQPIRPVHLDNVRRFPGYLDDYDVLLLSYELMKPDSPDLHYALARWVRGGGGLVYVGDGSDPYHRVDEWWNRGRSAHPTPAEHLFAALEVDPAATQAQAVGKGVVRVVRHHPSQFARTARAAEELRTIVRDVARGLGHTWTSRNRLVLSRGPYLIGHVLDEGTSPDPWQVRGRFIDLLDSTLRLVETRAVAPGEHVWLRAIDADPAAVPRILASAARVRNQDSTEGRFSFTSECPLGVRVRTALRVATKPTRVRIDGQAVDRYEFDERVGVLWLQHDGKPSGTVVQIDY